jgi:hypothetical protein
MYGQATQGTDTLRHMTTDRKAELVNALERFLREARQVVAEELGRDGAEQPSAETMARYLAALPLCRDVGEAANRAARANQYVVSGLHRMRRPDKTADEAEDDAGSSVEPAGPYGRPLDAEALVSTGIASMLLDPADHDLHAVAEDLAGYLAGPPVDIWDYAILDGNLVIEGAIRVADGWELVTPATEELRSLLPMPSTAPYQSARPFHPEDYGSLTMLRRVEPRARPHHRHLLRWDVLYSLAIDRPAHQLWQPLLALSLFDNSVLGLWARYQIEPGRTVDKLFDSVEWTVVTLPDGTDEDWPQFGDFGDIDMPQLERFLGEVEPLLAKALRKKTAGTRLKRCAEHFLSAGVHAHGEGEVLTELNAEAVLHYVIALEGLLAGTDPDRADFRRKVSQRAAILTGENDAARLEIARLVRGAYDVRSSYAHGSYPEEEFDLPGLRRIVRNCLLSRLIVGDPAADGDLQSTLDKALLSHEALERCIRQPCNKFWGRVRVSEQD